MRQAADRVGERDLVREVQVRALASEALVRLLSHDDDHVLAHARRDLVAFARVRQLRSRLEARADRHLEHLLGRSLQRPRLARDLELLGAAAVEVLERTSERDRHRGPLERPALLAHAAHAAAEQVLEAASEAALARGPLAPVAHIKELSEHLVRVAPKLVAHAAAWRRSSSEPRRGSGRPRLRLGVLLVCRSRAVLEALLSVRVVDLPLLRVRQHVVRLGDFLEFFFRGLLLGLRLGRVLVGVPFDRCLAVRFLQRRVVGLFVDAEQGVVIGTHCAPAFLRRDGCRSVRASERTAARASAMPRVQRSASYACEPFASCKPCTPSSCACAAASSCDRFAS
mmetsp:Transcript_35504/g.109946  ORF Transcript_35504/g.109946 Transcript_35504/m.109946 type:complete len:340 (-) Transcript_35504:238-1257(-)